MKKVYANATEALDGLLQDGMLIAAGGFGLCGIPERERNAVKLAELVLRPHLLGNEIWRMPLWRS